MSSPKPNPAIESIETPLRAGARTSGSEKPARPKTFRRKIDCDGRSGVAERRPQVRGARCPNRDQRSVY